MIASDGDVIVFGRAHPHPRSYGAFARVLSEYVGKRGVLTLEEGVRKMRPSGRRASDSSTVACSGRA